MKRRELLRLVAAGSLGSIASGNFGGVLPSSISNTAGLKKPVSVYITWASHDELSDNVPLTEELAMKQFEALLFLKNHGVKFDYFLLDMFWFDKHEGFRKFRKEYWPNGPDRWLLACKENGIKPGLWITTNITGWTTDPWMLARPEWKDSAGGRLDLVMSLHYGDFLKYHIDTMQMWVDRGIQMFKFDFADFTAATSVTRKLYTPDELIQKNEDAWFDALKEFRHKNPDVVLLAYNGYGGDSADTFPEFKKTVKLKWLEVFDSLYCGDPRPADVPCHNFWRAKDIYSDHMVRQYTFNGVPMKRIDNTAFIIGTTGTCYYRKKQAWKGMLLLSAARGGWMNTYYGNLDLLDEDDAKWFAKIQNMYYDLQQFGQFSCFGNIPGTGNPYGFVAENNAGTLLTFVNPSQKFKTIEMPQTEFKEKLLMFCDNGYSPVLTENSITLGPEQMALVGTGKYADRSYFLGIQNDVVIPEEITPLEVDVKLPAQNRATITVNYTSKNDLRIIFSQKTTEGRPLRISGGSPPDGVSMGNLLSINVFQDKRQIPLKINYDKQIWSGLSWAVAEIENKNFKKEKPLIIQYTVTDPQKRECVIEGKVYEVKYKQT